MLISVIIPLYKDWDRLLLCLEALKIQTADFLDFEVIIVNNDPYDEMHLENNYPFMTKFTSQSISGSYAARNKGLKLASGNGLLFTDSDCIPRENWIQTAISLLNTSSGDLIAGQIKLFSDLDNRYVRFDTALGFPNENYVKKHNFGVTANLLVRKSVFDDVGEFDPKLLTGGDAEFCHRAVKAGWLIEYRKELIVSHPARSSWFQLKNKSVRFGGRLPSASNSVLKTLKLVGKFRIRIDDVSQIYNLKTKSISQRVEIFLLKQQLRWVEACESVRVAMGKKPGRT
jgi:GT2 family glycosyltransferase